MMIDTDKILYKKVVYREKFSHYDQFGVVGNRYKFEYEIVISKCYSLKGKVWEISMPNGVFHDKNLYSLIVKSIEYATTKFPQYFRLVDELLRKDLWKKLG